MAVNGSISLSVAASKSRSMSIGSTYWNGNISKTLNFINGTVDNAIDLVSFSERTIASATTDLIDLAGSLADPICGNIVAAEIVALVVLNSNAAGTENTTNLTIGGGSSNQVTGFSSAVATVKPNGMYLLVNPDATGIASVVAGTGDILPIVNSSGASNTYQLAIFARSA